MFNLVAPSERSHDHRFLTSPNGNVVRAVEFHGLRPYIGSEKYMGPVHHVRSLTENDAAILAPFLQLEEVPESTK